MGRSSQFRSSNSKGLISFVDPGTARSIWSTDLDDLERVYKINWSERYNTQTSKEEQFTMFCLEATKETGLILLHTVIVTWMEHF